MANIKTPDVLYLTKEERILFEKLPDNVRAAWKGDIADETGTAYETPKQLQQRFRYSDLSGFPDLQKDSVKLWSLIARGQSIDRASVKNVPADAVPVLTYCMGATGIRLLINNVLTSVQAPNDIETIAAFSAIRHALLENNKEFLSSSPLYDQN